MNQKTTVLLVEDSPTQAEQFAAQLEVYSIDVITTHDGPTALRVAYEQQPDIVILDVNLPSMSGYQVCSRLKRDDTTSHIPVIILTTLDSPDDIWKGSENDPAGFATSLLEFSSWASMVWCEIAGSD